MSAIINPIAAAVKGLSTIRPLAARAVHVELQPAPRNIYESREVLRVLKDFGDILLFRNLRYDALVQAPNAMIAIYHTPEAATKLIDACPLRFSIDPTPPHIPTTSAASFGISEVLGNVPPEKPATTLQGQTTTSTHPPEDLQPREFHLSADRSFADHQAHIERQEYYWGFVRDHKSFVEEDLAKSVPLDGLATISSTPHQLPNRIVKKNLSEIASRRTLRQMWEEAHGASLP